MVLLPFLMASSLLIVSYHVSFFEPFPFCGAARFVFVPPFIPPSARSAVHHRVGVSLKWQQYASRRSAFRRHIGRQTEALRRHADKQIALRHGHHLVRHAVLPVCGVVRGVEIAFSRARVRVGVRTSGILYWLYGWRGGALAVSDVAAFALPVIDCQLFRASFSSAQYWTTVDFSPNAFLALL